MYRIVPKCLLCHISINDVQVTVLSKMLIHLRAIAFPFLNALLLIIAAALLSPDLIDDTRIFFI